MATQTTTKGAEVMSRVVSQLVSMIERGEAGSWVAPWDKISPTLWCPANAATLLGYRGGNRVALALGGMLAGYRSGVWATYRQWASVGAQVRRSAQATTILRPLELAARDDEQDDEITAAADGSRRRVRVVWRAAPVFNADQVEGYDPAPPHLHNPISEGERLLDGWKQNGMRIDESAASAYYSPATDSIHLPPRGAFPHLGHFYSVAAHEATHWTAPRVDRDLSGRFGDDAYALEELVAELGATMIAAAAGLESAPRTDHAAYLAHWLAVLKQHPRHLWTTAGCAQRASDYLLALAAGVAA